MSCRTKPFLTHVEVRKPAVRVPVPTSYHIIPGTHSLSSGKTPLFESLNQRTNRGVDPLHSIHITSWCITAFPEIRIYNRLFQSLPVVYKENECYLTLLRKCLSLTREFRENVWYTRWFKYDRDWFVCKQAALRSSCATLREWSHNLHPPSCSG